MGTPAHSPDSPIVPIRYAIDKDDRIIDIGGNWSAFAEGNDAGDLTASRLLGRRLWESLADATTIQLYQMMTARLRAGGAVRQIRFRCDAPETRRLLAMEMRGGADGIVEFIVVPVAEQARPSVALFDAHAPHGERLLTVCSWCKRVLTPDDRWVEADEAVRAWDLFAGTPMPGMSHGICGDCLRTIKSGADGPPDDGVIDVGRW